MIVLRVEFFIIDLGDAGCIVVEKLVILRVDGIGGLAYHVLYTASAIAQVPTKAHSKAEADPCRQSKLGSLLSTAGG